METIRPFSTPPSPSAPLCPRRKPRKWPAKRAGTLRRTQAGAGGRWWPLPTPAVVELTTIRVLAEADNVVIACGGGGIPVIATDHHHLKGAAAVIDKDLASELLAEHLDADMLIILTAVEKVAELQQAKPEMAGYPDAGGSPHLYRRGQFAPAPCFQRWKPPSNLRNPSPVAPPSLPCWKRPGTASTVKPAPVSPAELPRPPQPNTQKRDARRRLFRFRF